MRRASHSTRRRPGLLGTAGALAAGAIAWLTIAPAPLGGPVTYVSTTGVSMLPVLEEGDLALVRAASRYGPGDIVAYRNRLLGGIVVLHRIVRVEDGRYVLKGDNNDFLDPAPATREELIGRLWITVPNGGHVLGWLDSPTHAIPLALLAVLALASGQASRTRRRRRAAPDRSPRRPAAAPSLLDARTCQVGLLLAAAGLALAVPAHLRPATVTEERHVDAAHHGRFSYLAVAHAPGSPVARSTTGQPVFLRLQRRVRVAFDYRLAAAGPVRVGGTLRLHARLRDASCWQERLPLALQVPLTAGRARAGGTIDLHALRRRVAALDRATGLEHTNVLLDLQPAVTVSGTVGPAPLNSAFAPTLTFSLDALQLSLPGADRPETQELLAPRQELDAPYGAQVAARIALWRATPTVRQARLVATGTLAAAALLLLVSLARHARHRRRPEADSLARRHRDWLIPVSTLDSTGWQDVVAVASFESLLRLAERYDRLILHGTSADHDAFVVVDDGIAYLFTCHRAATGRPAGVPPAGELEAAVTFLERRRAALRKAS